MLENLREKIRHYQLVFEARKARRNARKGKGGGSDWIKKLPPLPEDPGAAAAHPVNRKKPTEDD